MSESSKPRGTSRLPRAQREEMLLDAATEEFGSMGYGGASLGSIADRAEVSKALLVTYFGSKDGLYGACAQRAGTNLADRIEAVITQDFTAGDMALRTLAAIFTGLEARPLDWNVLNDRTAPHDSPGGACARAQRQRIEEQATRAVASLKQLSDLDCGQRRAVDRCLVGRRLLRRLLVAPPSRSHPGRNDSSVRYGRQCATYTLKPEVERSSTSSTPLYQAQLRSSD